MKSHICIAAVLSLLATQAAAWPWQETVTKTMQLDAQGVVSLRADTGAGKLHIRGEKGIETITVEADITGKAPENQAYQLTLEQDGDVARLVSRTDSGQQDVTHIDIRVTVPADLALVVKDGSGDTWIRSIENSVSVDDGSGDLSIIEITGDVDVTDGSGQTEIITVTGNIDLTDGSGDVEVNTVTGQVSIGDGSGDIEVVTVSGDLDVRDNSGDIVVRTVTGEVRVRDGSGDIDVDTAMAFVLDSDGSGDVRLTNVNSR